MRKAIARLDPVKAGWVRSTLAPVNDKHEARFGMLDLMLFSGMVIGIITLARLFIAE